MEPPIGSSRSSTSRCHHISSTNNISNARNKSCFHHLGSMDVVLTPAINPSKACINRIFINGSQ
ncbi:hypothetical protein SPI_00364 [Niveomyces insectorum RCEF 264]|uniref:Uncharacterized protein n=1 Tax=Niveomyces insectorum RCEF 264 TaxID=1081102 RepID=A0A162MPU9_9HYPO|nr:hypothetical protein SPI_00364 [Niveomyces insectorum RCEF 264]